LDKNYKNKYNANAASGSKEDEWPEVSQKFFPHGFKNLSSIIPSIGKKMSSVTGPSSDSKLLIIDGYIENAQSNPSSSSGIPC
jgi:hypothetical protein